MLPNPYGTMLVPLPTRYHRVPILRCLRRCGAGGVRLYKPQHIPLLYTSFNLLINLIFLLYYSTLHLNATMKLFAVLITALAAVAVASPVATENNAEFDKRQGVCGPCQGGRKSCFSNGAITLVPC